MKILKHVQCQMVHGGLSSSMGSQLGANIGILGIPFISFNKEFNIASQLHTDSRSNDAQHATYVQQQEIHLSRH